MWKLKPELADALIELELIQEPASSVFPKLVDTPTLLNEGSVKTVKINAYERNPAARDICIVHYGQKCAVCEFTFESMYGNVGKGFIHVHHLKELSSIGEAYQVSPSGGSSPGMP